MRVREGLMGWFEGVFWSRRLLRSLRFCCTVFLCGKWVGNLFRDREYHCYQAIAHKAEMRILGARRNIVSSKHR